MVNRKTRRSGANFGGPPPGGAGPRARPSPWSPVFSWAGAALGPMDVGATFQACPHLKKNWARNRPLKTLSADLSDPS